jgi:hypothetical protein
VNTPLAGIWLAGTSPAMTGDGGTDTAMLATRLEHFLLLALRPGQVVVGAYKPDRLRALV